MPLLAILVVIIQLNLKVTPSNNAAAGGHLHQLNKWWNELNTFGGSFGYNVNAAKSWLVVKEGLLERAQHLFAGTGIQITTAGRPYLGAALGSTSFTTTYTQQRVSEWIEEISRLSLYAETQPHASHSAFIHPSGTITFIPLQISLTCSPRLSQLCQSLYS